MDDKTEHLIRELAEKFGTTSEYLWGVLIKQAPIDATCGLVVCGVLLLTTIGLIRRAYKAHQDYGGWSDSVTGLSLLAALMGLLTLMLVAANASLIIAGFFNPEYWALKQIIK